MTGITNRESAQHRPIASIDRMREFLTTAPNACPIRPTRLPARARCSRSMARSLTPSTETATPPAERNGRFEARSVPYPLPNRAPQCPGFRKREPRSSARMRTTFGGSPPATVPCKHCAADPQPAPRPARSYSFAASSVRLHRSRRPGVAAPDSPVGDCPIHPPALRLLVRFRRAIGGRRSGGDQRRQTRNPTVLTFAAQPAIPTTGTPVPYRRTDLPAGTPGYSRSASSS